MASQSRCSPFRPPRRSRIDPDGPPEPHTNHLTSAVVVAILTGLADERVTAQVLLVGAQRLLGKDRLDADDIQGAIRDCLASRTAS